MMGMLRRFLRWPWADKVLLLRAWLALLGVDLGVRLASFDAVQRFIDAHPKRGGANSPERLQRFVRHAARHHLWKMACLPQALALRGLLAREGVSSAVVIGVRKEGNALEAHAWVELDGKALGEPADVRERFQVMQSPALKAM
jgi:hypothetical protein